MEGKENLWEHSPKGIILDISNYGPCKYLLCNNIEDFKNWTTLLNKKFTGLDIPNKVDSFPCVLQLDTRSASELKHNQYWSNTITEHFCTDDDFNSRYIYKYLEKKVRIKYQMFSIFTEQNARVLAGKTSEKTAVELYKESLTSDF